MSPTFREKLAGRSFTIGIILVVAMFALAYGFGYARLQQQSAKLDREATEIQATADRLQRINKEQYDQCVARAKSRAALRVIYYSLIDHTDYTAQERVELKAEIANNLPIITCEAPSDD